MKRIVCVLFAFCIVIHLSGCSLYRAISLVRGGESHVRVDEETEIPFELSGHMILVKGRINNSSRDYTFMLDTGALTIVGKDLTSELGLTKEVGIKLIDVAEGEKIVYLAKLENFSLGGFKAEGISAAIFDMDKIRRITGIKVDGIIGSNFLRFFKVKIDYHKRLVTLSGNTAPFIAVPGASPVQIEQSMKMGFAPLVTVSCGDTTFDAAIDTGLIAPLSLPPSLSKEISQEAGIEGKGVMGGGAIRDFKKVRLVRLDSIRIGSRETGKIMATVAEGQKNALIGYTFLSNYVVTLNYPAGEMLLTPAEGGRNIDNIFTTGIVIRRNEAGKTLVSGIWSGSPADRLGIAMGNEILEINGRAVDTFTLQELRDQMYDDDRIKTVDLLIRSQFGERNFIIIKEYLF